MKFKHILREGGVVYSKLCRDNIYKTKLLSLFLNLIPNNDFNIYIFYVINKSN